VLSNRKSFKITVKFKKGDVKMNMIKNRGKKPVLKFDRFMILIVVGFFVMTNFICLPDVEAKKKSALLYRAVSVTLRPGEFCCC